MLRALALALLLAAPVAAEDVPPRLAAALGPEPLASYWMPNAANTEAIGITYTEIEGAAGNTNINTGYFTGGPKTFALVGLIPDLFGESPRDAKFTEKRIEITTTMPGPNDPRCCPTVATRWAIDRKTLKAKKIK